MFLISIIITVFNTEKYITRCLNSIINQTYRNFECIIINDGSTDNSKFIIENLINKDNRFIIYNQENKGLMLSRNVGIKSSKGDFICFVDSDDWLELNALELLINKQRETNADIVIGNNKVIYNNYSKERKIPNIKNIEYKSPIFYFLFIECNALWGKLYKKYLFNDYIIPSITIGEDAITNIQIFAKLGITNIKNIDNIIYNYDKTTSGMTTKKNYNYKSFKDNPDIIYRLWIKNYLTNIDNSLELLSLCNYYILKKIITFLKTNKIINKIDIINIYNDFYKSCTFINLLAIEDRYLIPILYKSISLGIFYKSIFLFLRRIANLLIKIKKDGFYKTLNYYRNHKLY